MKVRGRLALGLALSYLMCIACAGQRAQGPVAQEPPYVPRPSTREVAMDAATVFSRLVSALVDKNIRIISALKDAGLITTAPVFVPNIDRSDMGLGFRCGMAAGGGAFPYQCLDFSVQYQFLIRPNTPQSSKVTTSATVQAIDSRGIPRGQVSDPIIIDKTIEHLEFFMGIVSAFVP
jgi:hypothetical protein